MDRFSSESSASLQRSFRLSSRCFRDEDGIPDGEYLPVINDEAEDYEPPFQPLCSIGESIARFNYSTIGEYCNAMDAHKAVCAFCRGESKKTIQMQAGGAKPTGKAAA